MNGRRLEKKPTIVSLADDKVGAPELVRASQPENVRAALAHHSPRRHRVYEKGRLRIDFDAYEVSVDGRRVPLLLREFELLRFLVQSPTRVFDRAQIVAALWRRDARIDPRTVDVHVRRLRARIERDDAHPELIVTVRGVGYKFDDRPLMAAAGDRPSPTSPPARSI